MMPDPIRRYFERDGRSNFVPSNSSVIWQEISRRPIQCMDTHHRRAAGCGRDPSMRARLCVGLMLLDAA